MAVREYIDKFEDLYRFMADMLPSEENKYNRFLSGLHVTIWFGLVSFEGTTYRSLVEKALEVEKLKKKRKEKCFKNVESMVRVPSTMLTINLLRKKEVYFKLELVLVWKGTPIQNQYNLVRVQCSN